MPYSMRDSLHIQMVHRLKCSEMSSAGRLGDWHPEVVCVSWSGLPEKRLLKEVWKDEHIWSCG